MFGGGEEGGEVGDVLRVGMIRKPYNKK